MVHGNLVHIRSAAPEARGGRFHGLLIAFLATCVLVWSNGQAMADDGLYRVVYVQADDTLNVRTEPGSSSPLAGTLAPGTEGIRIIGDKQMVGESSWYPVEASGISGWVMGRYLAWEMDPQDYCAAAPTDVLDELALAVAERDGELLAALVDEERGLHLYLDMWSPGMRLEGARLRTIFTDPARSTWGLDPDLTPVEEGTFAENVLPLLERDLLHPTATACNAMNHPEAVQAHMVPDGTEGINYYSFYRAPGPDESEFDWGQWVVGVEYWNERLVLSYLAHYHWEP